VGHPHIVGNIAFFFSFSYGPGSPLPDLSCSLIDASIQVKGFLVLRRCCHFFTPIDQVARASFGAHHLSLVRISFFFFLDPFRRKRPLAFPSPSPCCGFDVSMEPEDLNETPTFSTPYFLSLSLYASLPSTRAPTSVSGSTKLTWNQVPFAFFSLAVRFFSAGTLFYSLRSLPSSPFGSGQTLC